MKVSDKLVATWAFLAAIRERTKKPVPYEPRYFAEIVQGLKESNGYASLFATYIRPGGVWAPDFEDGMALARAAGIIARGVPSYEWFTILMSKRVAEKYLEWAAPAPEVQAVADQYLTRVGLLPG
jgi:hypothetical protein